MQCFKITDLENRSCNQPDSTRVDYKVMTFVTAKIGGLLVFRDLESAIQFLDFHQYLKESCYVWTCECEEQLELPKFRLVTVCIEEAIALWNEGVVPVENLAPWVGGTLAFRRVKLIDKVK